MNDGRNAYMKKQLQELLEQRVQQCVSHSRNDFRTCPKIERKKDILSRKAGEIVKAKASGRIIEKAGQDADELSTVHYHVHFQYLIKNKDGLYLEEEVEQREAEFYKGVLVGDGEINPFLHMEEPAALPAEPADDGERAGFRYDRLKAVQYAERWWNDYNPAYKKFEVDCTNYISQCLHAGEAPMRGYPNRSKGWWMRSDNWSYSWTVANSLRWYLPGSRTGLKGKEVGSAGLLQLGDVICYDFQGDGRFDHTTIVTAKQSDGTPLVNAHTFNSRMRNWAYEDSTAYTPNIKYKFISIDDES
jgi:hypothetical protein